MLSRKIFKRGLLAKAVSLTCVGLATPAVAEEFFIEEVIVTATRRAMSAEEIPYNISAATGETLERRGITDFTKLARSTPGLTFTETGARDSGINSGLIIRGLNTNGSGSNDITSLVAPTVSTYVGETPTFVNLHLKDIERVEILRGPQGTLYGSGSLGGTIRYIHNKPDTAEFAAEVGSRLGRTHRASGLNTDSHAMLNIPLADNLAVRTVFGYVENQGFIDQSGLISIDSNGGIVPVDTSDPDSAPAYHSDSDTNGDRITHLRVSLLWDINDSTSALFHYQRQEDDADGRQVANTDHVAGGDYTNTQVVAETLERELDIYGVDIEADMGFASFSVSASHYENDSTLKGDQNGVYLNSDYWYDGYDDGFGNYISYYDGSPREAVIGDYENTASGSVVELRLASNGEGDYDYVIGAFWLEQELNTLQRDVALGFYDYSGWLTPLAPLGQDEVYHQEIETTYTDKAVFGEFTYHISDRWQVTVGARFFDQTFDMRNDIYLPNCAEFCSTDAVFDTFGNPVSGDPRGYVPTDTKADFNDRIFKLNTSYDLTDNVMVYFTWAEGFRHGGANGIPTFDTAPNYGLSEDPSLEAYDSDLATNWEIGAKGRALDDRLTFTGTAFWIDWDDIQIEGLSPIGSFPISFNGKSATSKGVELEAVYYFTESFNTTIGYAYTKAELTKDFNNGGIIGQDGDTLPGVPKHSATLSLDYTLSLDNGLKTLFHLNGSYIDEVTTDLNQLNGNYVEVDGYDIWDASISLEADKWSVSFFVDNITDERAPSNTRSPDSFNVDPSLNYPVTRPADERGRQLFSFVTRPRTVGMSFKYTF